MEKDESRNIAIQLTGGDTSLVRALQTELAFIHYDYQ